MSYFINDNNSDVNNDINNDIIINSSNENFIHILDNYGLSRASSNIETFIFKEKNNPSNNINNITTQINTITNNVMTNTYNDNKNINNNINDNVFSDNSGKNENNLTDKKNNNIFKIEKIFKIREDDLIYEFKTHFYQKFIITIANKIIGGKNDNERFLKVTKKVIQNQNIKPNLYLLNNSIEYFFSHDISSKYKKKFNMKHNKKLSDEYKKNDKFKKFIEMEVNDLYKIFKADDCENQLKEKFNIDYEFSLKSIITDMKEKNYNPYYIKKLEEIWSNIYKFFDKNKKHIKNTENFNNYKLFKIMGKNRPKIKHKIKRFKRLKYGTYLKK
jgi:hypothetical protein